MNWSIVYKQAYESDGSLFFPEKLSEEFLADAKRSMGTVLFANQYLNEVFAEEDQKFKRAYFKYWQQNSLPANLLTFAFVDPAISTADGADYTAIAVVSTDVDLNWYVRHIFRGRITPSQLVEKIFEVEELFKTQMIGVESIGFQKMIFTLVEMEMKRRNKFINVGPINPGTQQSKEARILSLVPRMEWGKLYFPEGNEDYEMEFLQFPKGRHDDMIDATASIQFIANYPQKAKEAYERNDPTSDAKFIKSLSSRPFGHSEWSDS